MAKVRETAASEAPAEDAGNPHLNPALVGKYRIKGTHCPIILNTSIGDIDFRLLTEDQAEQLVTDGLPWLEKIED